MTPSPEPVRAGRPVFNAEEQAYLKRLNDQLRGIGALMEAAAAGGVDGDRRPLPGIRERVGMLIARLPARAQCLAECAPASLIQDTVPVAPS